MKAKKISVRTTQSVQFINLDRQVMQVIKESGVQDGLCVVFVPHTTAGITINENADPDVVRDMVMEINKIVPLQDGYHHMEGNSAAHIKSSLFSPSLTLIIQDGRIVLGTWQSIYFCDFDGPRQRSCYVKVIAD